MAVRVLLLNPNSSKAMTDGMLAALSSVSTNTSITPYTAPPASPASINDDNDLQASTRVVLEDLKSKETIFQDCDAVLVACYSVHPLVAALRSVVPAHVVVSGIFEASILACLSLSFSPSTWGIVTTGPFWEPHLSAGVRSFLGVPSDTTVASFAGVFTTGLAASDFHDAEDHHHGGPDLVHQRLVQAAAALFQTGPAPVRCVVMGCAGMAGLEQILRDAARTVYGREQGDQVCIVDGVKAGVSLLSQTVTQQKWFQN